MAKLSERLPETVPEASDADDIHRIITSVHGIDDTILGTFTRRFDILFGRDCRGANGLFKNIRRGDRGMKCVVGYLNSIHWATAGIPFDVATARLTDVVKVLETLWCGTQLGPLVTYS